MAACIDEGGHIGESCFGVRRASGSSQDITWGGVVSYPGFGNIVLPGEALLHTMVPGRDLSCL